VLRGGEGRGGRFMEEKFSLYIKTWTLTQQENHSFLENSRSAIATPRQTAIATTLSRRSTNLI
jgi:hypothetical protein